MSYTPESPWQVTQDNSLIYTLRQVGWRNGGAPAVGNDVEISIRARNLTDDVKAEIVAAIFDTLELRFPCENTTKK